MRHADYCAQFVTPPEKILDVGSGRGKFLLAMAERGFAAYGVETNPAYIAEAEKDARARGLNVTFLQGKGEELPLPNAYFDFVNCAEVTEHVENPEKLCQEIFRVLKTKGKCYISFHNRFGIYDYHYHLWGINWLPRAWTEPILKLLRKQKPDGQNIGRQKLTTMHYYTFARLKKVLLNTGFDVRDIREDKIKKIYGAAGPLIRLIYRMVRPIYFNTFHLLLEK